MKVRRSSELLDRFSAVMNAMRAVSSGTTTAISDPLNPAWARIWLMRGRVASTFFPAGNSATDLLATRLRCEFTPATIPCLDVNSHAHNGASGLKNSVIVSTRPLLNECDLVDYLQRGDSCKDFRESGVAQERHAFVMRHPLDFRRWFFLNDHFTNTI